MLIVSRCKVTLNTTGRELFSFSKIDDDDDDDDTLVELLIFSFSKSTVDDDDDDGMYLNVCV